MQTLEDILYHAHELGIYDKVLINVKDLKKTKNYFDIKELIEDAYYLTKKQIKMHITESKDWASSLVKKTEYAPDTKDLVIEFSNGKKYLYKNFNTEQYQAFCNAESQGKHFLTEIRKKYKDTEDVIKLNTDE